MSPRERPIIFNAPMVRAILDGSKTQTRRVVNPQPSRYLDRVLMGDDGGWYGYSSEGDTGGGRCPYGVPGDRLWVRETWRPDVDSDVSCVAYRADDTKIRIANTKEAAYRWIEARRPEEQWPDLKPPKWRPSIFMPRWASRITLDVTDVRVQRVQDISEEDAEAEGIRALTGGSLSAAAKAGAIAGLVQGMPRVSRRAFLAGSVAAALGLATGQFTPRTEPTNHELFATLWDSINGKKPGRSWDDNPWVWALTFRRVTP